MSNHINNDWGGLHLTPQERENRVALLEGFYNNSIVRGMELSPFADGELLLCPSEVGPVANQPKKRTYDIYMFPYPVLVNPTTGEPTNPEEGEL